MSSASTAAEPSVEPSLTTMTSASLTPTRVERRDRDARPSGRWWLRRCNRGRRPRRPRRPGSPDRSTHRLDLVVGHLGEARERYALGGPSLPPPGRRRARIPGRRAAGSAPAGSALRCRTGPGRERPSRSGTPGHAQVVHVALVVGLPAQLRAPPRGSAPRSPAGARCRPRAARRPTRSAAAATSDSRAFVDDPRVHVVAR